MNDLTNAPLNTPNFSWAELLGSCPRPTDMATCYQLHMLAQRLQAVRDVLKRPIIITSGYRNVSHNRAVGGHPNSYHVRGMAADIVVPGLSARQVQQQLSRWSGGLGCYPSFTHVDIGPKRRWGPLWKSLQVWQQGQQDKP